MATATAAFLPLGTGPAWCTSDTVARVIHVGTQWTVSAVGVMWLPYCVISVSAQRVSRLDGGGDDADDDDDDY